jgi:hypothetical protein
MTPSALINALLKAEIDLLWFGGIGTYIKSSSQSHLEAGDRANDSLRINGNEVRAKVVGEGANLGITSSAASKRPEPARASTPTRWTTAPGWTPPTTKSISRSCWADR